MIRALIYALFTALVVFGIIWISKNPGEVVINWLGYQVNTSVVLLIMVLLALIWLIKLFLLPFSFWAFLRKEHSESRRKNQQKLLVEILAAAAAMDEKKYGSLEKRINSTFADNPTLKNLLLLNVTKGAKRLEVLNTLTIDQDTELASLKVRLDEALAANKKDEALALSRTAFASFPAVNWIAKQFIGLLGFFGEWDEICITAEEAYRKGAISKPYMLTAKSFALLEKGIQNNEPKNIIAAAKLDKNNQEAQIKTAFYYHNKGDKRKALSVLLKSWKVESSLPVYDAARQMIQSEDKIKRFKFMQKMAGMIKGKPLAHLLMAEAYTDNSMWAAARVEIDKYLLLYPDSGRAAAIMTAIENNQNPDSDVAKKWSALAADNGAGKLWKCEKCGNGFAEWHAVCPSCQTFGFICPRAEGEK